MTTEELEAARAEIERLREQNAQYEYRLAQNRKSKRKLYATGTTSQMHIDCDSSICEAVVRNSDKLSAYNIVVTDERVDVDKSIRPVSYTHLTLPTN